MADLCAYAEAVMRAEAPVEGTDASLDAHLRQVAKTTGKDPAEFVAEQLGMPEPPWELERLWEVFVSLSSGRARGFAGEPLSLADVDAWCRLYGVTLAPWEVDGLRALDRVALRVLADSQRKASKR